MGWDPSKKLIYIPNGGQGNVTVVHQDSPDKYSTVGNVTTQFGTRTMTLDPKTHHVFTVTAERRSLMRCTLKVPRTVETLW